MRETYEPPNIEIVEIEIEMGFAQSGGSGEYGCYNIRRQVSDDLKQIEIYSVTGKKVICVIEF